MKAQWYSYASERAHFVSRCARKLRKLGHKAEVVSHCQMTVDGAHVELRVGQEGVLAVWRVELKSEVVDAVDLMEVL